MAFNLTRSTSSTDRHEMAMPVFEAQRKLNCLLVEGFLARLAEGKVECHSSQICSPIAI